MQQEILCNRDDFKSIEVELRSQFIRATVEEMGIKLDEVWPEDKIIFETVEDKIKFREVLAKYNILVIDDHDGGTKIYVEEEMIGEWKKTKYQLQTDLSQIDPSKKVYIKMLVECWSVFEDGA